MLAYNVLSNVSSNSKFKFHLVYRKAGNFNSTFETLGLKLWEISPIRKLDIQYLIKLRKFIRTNKIDIVHVHQPLDLLYYYISTLGLKTKLIITHHGFSYSENQNLFILLSTLLTNKNIFVSNSCLTMYEKLINKKIKKGVEILYNGIDLNKFKSKILNDIKKELNIPSESTLFAMTANFYIDARDQFTICQALNIAIKENNNIHFLFIGGKSAKHPEYYDICFNYCLDHKINNNVHFIGSRNDVPDILKQIDFYVYSTKYETFGISVVEAMSLGIECIVNDIPTMIEITKNGKHGTLYKTGDFKTLSKLIQLKAKEKSSTEFKNTTIKYVEENFSIEKHIQSLTEIYYKTIIK